MVQRKVAHVVADYVNDFAKRPVGDDSMYFCLIFAKIEGFKICSGTYLANKSEAGALNDFLHLRLRDIFDVNVRVYDS